MPPNDDQQTPSTNLPEASAENSAPPPPTNISPPVPAPGGRKKLSFAVIMIVLLILAVAGSAAAYLVVVQPKSKPENALKEALKNTLQKHQVAIKGTLDVENLNTDPEASFREFSTTFDAKTDTDKHAFAATVEVKTSGVNVPVELRSVDRGLYVKVGDLASVKGALQLTYPNLVPIVDEVNKKVANQWIEIDDSLLRQGKAECLFDFPTSLTQEDVDILVDGYKDSSFATIKNTVDEDVEGAASTRYNLSVDEKKANEYGKKFKELAIFKKLEQCSQQISNDSVGGDDLDEELKSDGSTTELSLWIDKSKKVVNKIELSGSDKESKGSVKMNFAYDNVTITKPESSKPVLQLIGELGPAFQGVLGGAAPPKPGGVPGSDTPGDFNFE